jgi:ubiquinone/menaquinone biosynthesis C-methylase UbiE
MRVLDVACGTGAVLVQAAGLVGPTGLVVGVDLAEPMVAVAARRLQQMDPA